MTPKASVSAARFDSRSLLMGLSYGALSFSLVFAVSTQTDVLKGMVAQGDCVCPGEETMYPAPTEEWFPDVPPNEEIPFDFFIPGFEDEFLPAAPEEEQFIEFPLDPPEDDWSWLDEQPDEFEICGNGIDDNWDGNIDNNDWQCAVFESEEYSIEEPIYQDVYWPEEWGYSDGPVLVIDEEPINQGGGQEVEDMNEQGQQDEEQPGYGEEYIPDEGNPYDELPPAETYPEQLPWPTEEASSSSAVSDDQSLSPEFSSEPQVPAPVEEAPVAAEEPSEDSGFFESILNFFGGFFSD